MVEITEEFKVRFNRAIERKNIKPADLSRQTGISESTISQYRSGYSKPKDKRLVILANALGVDPTWLMGIDAPDRGEELRAAYIKKARRKRYDRLFSYLDRLSDKDIDMLTDMAKRLSGEVDNGD